MRLASQEQRHREQNFSDSPFQGTWWGMERLREEATRGSLQSLAPCPEPSDMCLGQGCPLVSEHLVPVISKVATPDQRCPSICESPGAGLRNVRSGGQRSSFPGVLPPRPGPSGGLSGHWIYEGGQEPKCFMQVLRFSGWRGWHN